MTGRAAMRLEVERTSVLTFTDGSPVRAASAIAPFGDGWLVAPDDATHAAWWRGDSITAVRVVEPVDGLEVFSSAAGTKHLKPDFEAACAVSAGGVAGVLLLGSGSTRARMRASLVTLPAGPPGSEPAFAVADLRPVYRKVAAALGLRDEQLNLEGACVLGDRLRWFQRGNPVAGARTASVDVHLAGLLAAVTGAGAADRVEVGHRRTFDLGAIGGVALGVTDATPLADGRVLVSAAAEDTPNAVDDGPVVGAALALLDDDGVVAITAIPGSPHGPYKVEGLTVIGTTTGGVRLLAVVDQDDPAAASVALTLRLWW